MGFVPTDAGLTTRPISFLRLETRPSASPQNSPSTPPTQNSKPKTQNLSHFTMQTYYYVLASQRFLTQEEPIDEILKERTRHYHEQEKAIDFWLVNAPAFLDAPALTAIKAKCPQPASAIISTNPQFITWLKLRLEFVITGEFQAPSETIPQPLASLAAIS